MTFLVTIVTGTLRVCQDKKIEAKSSLKAVLNALHHGTSAYFHLQDLPMAQLGIAVFPKPKSPDKLKLEQRTQKEAA